MASRGPRPARASCTASGRLHAGGALLDRATAACAWSRSTFASPRLLAIFELLAFQEAVATTHDLSRARARGSGQFGLPKCPPCRCSRLRRELGTRKLANSGDDIFLLRKVSSESQLS